MCRDGAAARGSAAEAGAGRGPSRLPADILGAIGPGDPDAGSTCLGGSLRQVAPPSRCESGEPGQASGRVAQACEGAGGAAAPAEALTHVSAPAEAKRGAGAWRAMPWRVVLCGCLFLLSPTAPYQVWTVSLKAGLSTYKGSGADALQRPLCSCFQARLTAGVDMICIATDCAKST